MIFTDKSGPRGAYFLTLQAALHRAGICTPALVIDRDRLERNIDRLMADIPEGMDYRIVAKSLPSPALLAHVRARSGSNRLMSFNLPMLRDLSRIMPDADQLLGKPLPEAAARNFFAGARLPYEQIQWLIDTPARLRGYDAIAKANGVTLRVALELDIGLHRGGVAPGPDLAAMLEALTQAKHLRFSGLMGYEPHLASVPRLLGWQRRARTRAWALYAAAKAQIRERMGAGALEGATLNTAGSPTYRLYRDTDLVNEIAAGSVLVKPTDFDTPLLAAHEPAAFIATPLLKGPSPSPLPALERIDRLRRWLDPNQARTLFIHGGHWLANPEDPPGLRYNATFGRSSNQEMLTGGARTEIAPGDFVFLRPSQSEAVLLQFGPILVYAGGEIIEQWETFAISA